MIVHGIPGPYRLDDGDILSVDIGVTLDGFIGDAAYTFAVGEISEEAARLLATGQEALAAGIAECRTGRRLSDVSHAVQEVTEAAGFASCARSSATASAARCTRTRRSRTTACPAGAGVAPAWCSRSSR